jgi:poly-gamma-glutamate capsule biosynthesis protein CapA/YwtB (metallophosphatase superfamily)
MTADTPLLRIAAVGDISFEGAAADSRSAECFADVADGLRRADIAVANLECTLTGMGSNGVRGKCTLRGSPGWARVLKEAGVDLVTLANNHVMDFGREGLFATMEALQRAGVAFVDAGGNRDEACAPVFMELAQRRVAFLGMAAGCSSIMTLAHGGLGGAMRGARPPLLRYLVALVRDANGMGVAARRAGIAKSRY